MNMDAVTVWVLFAMLVQLIVICVITVQNKEVLDRHKASSYPDAIHDLSLKKPKAAMIIKICYAAGLFELLLLMLFK